MVTLIDTFKKIYLDLDISGGITQQFSLTNNTSYNNSCFLNLCFVTNVQNQSVTITVIQKTSISGTTEDTQTFVLNYNNSILKKNINLITAYTLINIDYSSFNGILTGFIEKLNFGDSIIVNANNNLVDVKGFIDVSGQRLDISGQRLDISGQRLDISGQRLDISGQRLDISGQRLDISGQRLDISGQRLDISGQRLDISGQRLDVSGQRVDISGQSIVIQGYDGTNNRTIETDLSGNLYSIITDGTNTVQVTNNSSITGSNIYGLNMYQIFPKVKSFPFNTLTSNTGTDILMVQNGTFTPYNIGFGLANAKKWYALSTVPLAVDLNYTYVDNSGNEGSHTMSIPFNSWTELKLTGGVTGSMISVNDYKSLNRDISGNVAITLAAGTGATTSTIAFMNRWVYATGVFTCPNNAIAWISDITIYLFGGTNDNIRLWKYDASGFRRPMRVWYAIPQASETYNITGGSQYNPIGGYLQAGETFAWSCENSTTSKYLYSTINVMYF